MKTNLWLGKTHLTPFRTYSWFTFLMLLVLGSCQRRCSFTRVIKKDSKKVQINGVPVTIKAALKKTTRYRRNSRKLFDVSKTSASYRVVVEVAIDGKDYLVQTLPAKAKEKLETYEDKVTLKAASDNYYLAAAYEGQVQVILQKMGKRYYESPYGKKYEQQSMAQIDLSTLPNEAAFLQDIIHHRVQVMRGKAKDPAEQAFVEYFSQQRLNEEETITLFQGWPNRALAAAYFTPKRIGQIKNKYPKWKAAAKEKTNKFLKSNRGFMKKQIPNYIQLFLALAEQDEIQKLDVTLVDKWGNTFEDVATAYFLERVRMTDEVGVTLEKRYVDQIEARSIQILQGSNVKRAKSAIEFLLLIGNGQAVQAQLNTLLKSTRYWEDEYRVKMLVNNNYDLYPPKMQQQITSFYEVLFMEYIQAQGASDDQEHRASRRPMKIAGVYNFLRDKISCEQLKKLRKSYEKTYDRGSRVFLKESAKCD